MIPDFNERGYLPSGVHPATVEEVEARFGQESELRRVQMESIRWMLDLARRVGVLRIILNGSFVTDAIEPNDVDCVLLIGPDFPADSDAAREFYDGLPFLDLQLVEAPEFVILVEQIFATDRDAIPKGVIEVLP